MIATYKSSLYDKLIIITDIYLGPASNRFIKRQIQNHLHKKPEEIEREDLLELVDWIKVVVSLLTNQEDLVEDYIEKVRRLAVEDISK